MKWKKYHKKEATSSFLCGNLWEKKCLKGYTYFRYQRLQFKFQFYNELVMNDFFFIVLKLFLYL